MNASTAELIEMFRGSFSPINSLSAGRMAQQQMAIQRAYAEQQRKQALQDHITGLMIQDKVARGRDEITNRRALERDEITNRRALELEVIRDQNAIARARTALEENRKFAETTRTADEIRGLKDTLSGLGEDPTEFGDDAVKLRSRRAQVVGKARQSATEIAKQIEGLNTQLETMAGSIEIPAADQLRMARPYALAAAAGDEKKSKLIRAAASIDDLREIVADDPVALGKIDTAITNAALVRGKAFESRARPIQTRMTQLQRTLGALEQKGITPDYDALRKTVEPAPTDDAGGMVDDDLSGEFEFLGDTGAAAATPTASAGRSNALSIGAGAAGTAAMIPAARRAVARGAGAAARGALPAVGRVAAGAMRSVPYVGPAMLGYGVGSEIDEATGASDAIAGLHGTFGDELAGQRANLARIDQMIRQTQDPAVAGRLRALRYAPTIDEDTIRRALGQPTSDAAGWLQGF